MQKLVMWVKCDKYLGLVEFLKSYAYFMLNHSNNVATNNYNLSEKGKRCHYNCR